LDKNFRRNLCRNRLKKIPAIKAPGSMIRKQGKAFDETD
jgi:hypothetical protein